MKVSWTVNDEKCQLKCKCWKQLKCKCWKQLDHRCDVHLEGRGHEDGAAHQDEDHEAGDPLLSDAQKLWLLAGRRALWLQLQTVDMWDGEHGRCHEPRQAHDRAHAQHHRHHQQVQVVATAFLQPKHTRGGMFIIELLDNLYVFTSDGQPSWPWVCSLSCWRWRRWSAGPWRWGWCRAEQGRRQLAASTRGSVPAERSATLECSTWAEQTKTNFTPTHCPENASDTEAHVSIIKTLNFWLWY